MWFQACEQLCDANGYGEFDNCSTLGYIIVMPLFEEMVIDLEFVDLS